MNWAFIRHIVRFEIKWKTRYLRRFTIAIPLIFFGLKFAPKESHPFFIGISILIAISISLISGITPSAAGLNQQSNHQSLGFAWKYLHSVINNKVSFVAGYCLSGIISSFLGLILILMLFFHYDVQSWIFVAALPSFWLLVSTVRILNLINTIKWPSRNYYQYHEKFTLNQVLKDIGKLFSVIVHFGSLFAAFFLFNGLVYNLNKEYAFFSLFISSLIAFFLTFSHLMQVWSDERYARFNFRRQGKRTISYLFSTAFLYVLVSTGFDGEVFKSEKDIFELVREGEVETIKNIDLTPNLLQQYNSKGYQPLHVAVLEGRLNVVEELVGRGADLEGRVAKSQKNKKDYQLGLTPLLLAIDQKESKIAKLLIEKGANVNAKSKYGVSGLSIAAFRCNLPIMKELIDNGANINSESTKGLTPLFYAVKGKGCLTGVLYLRKVGANDSILSAKGKTYMKYAEEVNPLFHKELEFYEKLFRH